MYDPGFFGSYLDDPVGPGGFFPSPLALVFVVILGCLDFFSVRVYVVVARACRECVRAVGLHFIARRMYGRA